MCRQHNKRGGRGTDSDASTRWNGATCSLFHLYFTSLFLLTTTATAPSFLLLPLFISIIIIIVIIPLPSLYLCLNPRRSPSLRDQSHSRKHTTTTSHSHSHSLPLSVWGVGCSLAFHRQRHAACHAMPCHAPPGQDWFVDQRRERGVESSSSSFSSYCLACGKFTQWGGKKKKHDMEWMNWREKRKAERERERETDTEREAERGPREGGREGGAGIRVWLEGNKPTSATRQAGMDRWMDGWVVFVGEGRGGGRECFDELWHILAVAKNHSSQVNVSPTHSCGVFLHPDKGDVTVVPKRPPGYKASGNFTL